MEIQGFAIDVINELVRIEQNLRFINDDIKGVANLKSRSDSLRAIFEWKFHLSEMKICPRV